MDIKVCSKVNLDLSNSCLLDQISDLSFSKTVKVNGVGVFDDNGKILPLISQYLSYQAKHEKISNKSAETYARNLTYFLKYIRSRSDYSNDESDEVFLTVPSYVIQEYLTFLSQENKTSSATVRNRDATIRAFIEFLCTANEYGKALRKDNPYSHGFLSKAPKRTPIRACTLDELAILMNSTNLEREKIILQFLYDSGLRRSELPRLTLEDFIKVMEFNKQKFAPTRLDQPIYRDYISLQIKGSKGRGNEIKSRSTLVSSATIGRIQKYHASPLYKKYARKYASASETPAFFNAHGTPFTAKSISKLLYRLSKRAIKKGILNKDIAPHKLRHGYAYAVLQSNDLGADYLDRLVIVQKNLGHSHLDTTQMYTSIPQEIYNSMCDEKGDLLTRAEKMRLLTEQTQSKIGLKDSK